jgi:uncharacterized membrane protein
VEAQMQEKTHSSIEINSDLESCLSVILDVENYPSWAKDIKEVNVLDRDPENRPLLVKFRTAAFGRSTTYTLKYDYSEYPDKIAWNQIQGDITTKIDGSYHLQFDGSKTKVNYELEIEAKVPLPGFIKRRAESRLIQVALSELKNQIEKTITTK